MRQQLALQQAALLGIAALAPLTAWATSLKELEDGEATRCKDMKGATPAKRLVTQKFLDAVDAIGSVNTDHFVVVNAEDARYNITNGCPIHYGMMANEVIHTAMVRPDDEHLLLMQWYHERWFAVSQLHWHTEGIPTSRWAPDYVVDSHRLEGQMTWSPHVYNYDSRYFFQQGRRRWTRGAEHYGEHDPMYMDIKSDFAGSGAATMFEGWWKFSFHVTSTHMAEDQYNAMHDLFTYNCQPWRDDKAPDERLDWSKSIWRFRYYESMNHDDVPYCEWMRTGWKPEVQNATSPVACAVIEGLACDKDGMITHMYMNTEGLEGTLHRSFANLKRLSVVEMKFNRLMGKIPGLFENHPQLYLLDLEHNQFTGTVPCFEGSEKLDILRLNTNKFTGTLGSCLGKLTGLQDLDISTNDISGSLPDDLGKLTRLAALHLEENHLLGTLPVTMCDMKGLHTIDISRNRFVGSFPEACIKPSGSKGWERLSELDVASNRMTGTLPTFGDMKKLKRVRLSYNYFQGTVTDQFNILLNNSEWGTYTEVYANGNNLNGPFPEIAYNMTFSPKRLDRFDISDNHFRCEKSGRFPAWTIRATFATHGNCIAVPKPKSISPTSGQIGTKIIVNADDVLPGAQPSCKFYKTTNGRTVEAFSGATLLEAEAPGGSLRLECYVPTTLGVKESGDFHVTVANYGTDFASNDLVVGYSPPKFSLSPTEEMSSGVVVSTEVTITGVPLENLNEASFREVIAAIVSVDASLISIQLPETRRLAAAEAGGRRLQQLAITVNINVPAVDPESAETQAKVKQIQDQLTNEALVKEKMEQSGFTLATYNFAPQAQEKKMQDVNLGGNSGGGGSEDNAMPGIIGAAAGGFLVICLCSIICFIRYREKKGQPYFSEALDEGNTAGAIEGNQAAGNSGGDNEPTGATYGNTA